MARRPKGSPAYGRGYTCAEDLCDPFDEGFDPGDDRDDRSGVATRRPRNRAQRLVDSLDEPAEGKAGHRAVVSPHSDRKLPAVAPDFERPADCRPATCRPVTCRTVTPTAPFPNRNVSPAILSINPVGEGEMVAVLLAVPGDGEGESATQCVVHLLVEQYTLLALRAGVVSAETVEQIREAGELCAAIRRGIRLLSYGDTSARRLAYKLTARGVDGDIARGAVAYLTKRGYIREDNAARRRAEQGVSKLWGPRRIREDLRAGGFSPDAVEDAMETLSQVDFEENCRLALAKKRPPATLDRPTYQKLTAYLLRLGYGGDTVRRALQEWEE